MQKTLNCETTFLSEEFRTWVDQDGQSHDLSPWPCVELEFNPVPPNGHNQVWGTMSFQDKDGLSHESAYGFFSEELVAEFERASKLETPRPSTDTCCPCCGRYY